MVPPFTSGVVKNVIVREVPSHVPITVFVAQSRQYSVLAPLKVQVEPPFSSLVKTYDVVLDFPLHVPLIVLV